MAMESVGEFEFNKRDLIGHGAFAVVFRGRHKQDHMKEVAIKCISKKNLAKSQTLLGKEIRILKELQHENIVALYDCQEISGSVYLVMEYCNGGDLADYLQVKGTLSEDTIRLFLQQIASAMRVLHGKGIIHRDLKPQNILVQNISSSSSSSLSAAPLCGAGAPIPAGGPPPTTTGPPGSSSVAGASVAVSAAAAAKGGAAVKRIKIADFGFARYLQSNTMAATLCGSPMYMAPEVIMSQHYDAKADLWSIGTIVFQCLTGKAPFQASSPQDLRLFYEKNKNLLPNIPSGTSPPLSDLLLRLLKRNQKDRMEFDEFFSHAFLDSSSSTMKKSVPISVPLGAGCISGSSCSSNSSSSHLTSPRSCSELPRYPGSPGSPPACPSPSALLTTSATTGSEPSSSSCCCCCDDDFVIVPHNVPYDLSCAMAQPSASFCRRLSGEHTLYQGGGSPGTSPGNPRPSPSPAATGGAGAATGGPARRGSNASNSPSPCRPSHLGVSARSEALPIPVPTQRHNYQRIQQQQHSPTSPTASPRAPPAVRRSNTSPHGFLRVGAASPTPPEVGGGARRLSVGGTFRPHSPSPLVGVGTPEQRVSMATEMRNRHSSGSPVPPSTGPPPTLGAKPHSSPDLGDGAPGSRHGLRKHHSEPAYHNAHHSAHHSAHHAAVSPPTAGGGGGEGGSGGGGGPSPLKVAAFVPISKSPLPTIIGSPTKAGTPFEFPKGPSFENLSALVSHQGLAAAATATTGPVVPLVGRCGPSRTSTAPDMRLLRGGGGGGGCGVGGGGGGGGGGGLLEMAVTGGAAYGGAGGGGAGVQGSPREERQATFGRSLSSGRLSEQLLLRAAGFAETRGHGDAQRQGGAETRGHGAFTEGRSRESSADSLNTDRDTETVGGVGVVGGGRPVFTVGSPPTGGGCAPPSAAMPTPRSRLLSVGSGSSVGSACSNCGRAVHHSDSPPPPGLGGGGPPSAGGGPGGGGAPPASCLSVSPPSSLRFGTSPPNMMGEVAFEPPALPEETLMEREHTDTLRDLTFLLSFAESLMEVAAWRGPDICPSGPPNSRDGGRPPSCRDRAPPPSSWDRGPSCWDRGPASWETGPPQSWDGGMPPNSSLLQESAMAQHVVAQYGNEWGRAEQLVLYMKAAELLASALYLAKEKVQTGKLNPSTAVKQVARSLNVRYKESVRCCRELSARLARFLSDKQRFVYDVGSVSAERLVYSHAIELVRATALDEMFQAGGAGDEVLCRYRRAALLLDGLAHIVTEPRDLQAISKYKLYVERHVENLQQQQGGGASAVVDY